MSGLAEDLVPLFKAVHILALLFWCGGLLALPLMASRHDVTRSPVVFARVRMGTHLAYTLAITPAAVIAVVAGTWLLFFRETFVPWFYAKLVLVALLVIVHAWIGRLVLTEVEHPEPARVGAADWPVLAVLILVLGILVLVLAKPDLGGIAFPDWLTEPRGRQLPFDVPSL